ncbi:pilus assembly PilX N-terminal domain-containing protein [Vogesella sp. GCM10023246]|uniref:Pilus assembly PilX N-terminal domain-containing protein n=1 Tax=Vogesella oryzagri TaxID=3160864 RepID=A0ABV1M7S4_9NEIS
MQNQRGFTTLLVSLILVMLVSLNVIIGSRSSALEVKSANNLYRTEAAFQNAEQGIRAMLTQLNATIAATPDVALSNTKRADSLYTVNFCTAASADCVASSSLPFPFIKSTGVDPSGATRTISQRVNYSFTAGTPPIIPTPVTDALTALGNISIGGNADVSSVKSGGTVNSTGSGSVGSVTTSDFYQKTLVNGVETYLLAANGSKIKWTTDEFFMHYFGGLCPNTQAAYDLLRATGTATSVQLAQQAGYCKAEVKATVAARSDGYICASSCNNADLSAAYASGARLMWLTAGGMKINANVVLGSTTDPVIIFVMESGTVQINGTSKIYGVVYVDVPEISSTVTNVTSTTTCNCTAKTTRISKKGNEIQWSSPSYEPTTATQWCTIEACKNASVALKCTPSTPSSTAVGDSSTCTYNITVDVGDLSTPGQTQVVIEVLGTWDNSGGGNALIEGAALTSGNYSTTGGIEIVKNTGIVTKFQAGTPGVNSIATSSSGWSDMN